MLYCIIDIYNNIYIMINFNKKLRVRWEYFQLSNIII